MVNDVEAAADVLLLIAVTVPLVLLWAAVIVDLLRRKDLSIGRKVMWLAIVVFTVYIGVVLYFIFRPVPPPSGKHEKDKDERASGIVTSIEVLHVQHAAGDISDSVYLSAKRELLGLDSQDLASAL
jgi:uncharacterized membrane protein